MTETTDTSTIQAQVLNHLKSGQGISQQQANDLFHCWRLADVIFKLRNKGHNIKTVTKESISSNPTTGRRQTKYYGYYFLEE